MSNVLVTALECIGLVAAVTGIVLLICLNNQSAFMKQYRLLAASILLVSLFKSCSNVLQWSQMTGGLDWFDELVEVLHAMLLSILFYTILQHRLFEQVCQSETRYRGLVDQMTATQNEREDLLRKLEFKNDELQNIVDIASHDLKSPLVNILGFNGELHYACRNLSEKLEQAADPELRNAIRPLVRDIQESQQFIESGGTKMQVLIDGLLKVSRIGTQPIEIRCIEMTPMIEGILRTMKYQIQMSKAVIRVGPLPPCMGDPAQVNQVFTNLIDNAIKYLHPARPGVISIEGCKDGKWSVYRVNDNGIGIQSEFFSKIFEIYHRLNPETENTGQGLGLTIVGRIMERLGGRVAVESEYGKGSTFIVRLPSCEH